MYPSSTILFQNNDDDDLSTLSGSTVTSYVRSQRSWRSRLKSKLSSNLNGDGKRKEDGLLIAISDYILSTQKQEESGIRSITRPLRESIRRKDSLDVPFDELVPPKVILHDSNEPATLSPFSRSRRSQIRGDNKDDDESSTESLLECGWKVQSDGTLEPILNGTPATLFTPIDKDELIKQKDFFHVGTNEELDKPVRSALPISYNKDKVVEAKKHQEVINAIGKKEETMSHEVKSPLTPDCSKLCAILLEKEQKYDASHGSKTMDDVGHDVTDEPTTVSNDVALEVSTPTEGRDHGTNSSDLYKLEKNDESISAKEPGDIVLHEKPEEDLISKQEDGCYHDHNGKSVLMDMGVSTMRFARKSDEIINKAKQIIVKKKMKKMDIPFDEIPIAMRPERRSKLNTHPHDEEIEDSFSIGRKRLAQADARRPDDVHAEDSSGVRNTVETDTPQENDAPPSPQLTTLSVESYENDKSVSYSTPTCQHNTPEAKSNVDNKIKNKKDFRSRLERLKQKKFGLYSEKLKKLHIYASNDEKSSTVGHRNVPQTSITKIEKVEVTKENNLSKLKDQIHATKAAVVKTQTKLVFFSSRKDEDDDDDGSKISKKSHRQMLLDISLTLPPPPPPASPGSNVTKTTQTTSSMSTISRSTQSHSTGYHCMLKELFEGDDETFVQDESYVRRIPQTPSIKRTTYYQKNKIIGLFSPPKVERIGKKMNHMTLQRDVFREQDMKKDLDDHVSCVSSVSSSEESVSDIHPQSLVIS